MPITARIIGGTLMLLSGGAFGAGAIYMLRKSFNRANNGVRTQGIIVGSDVSRKGSGQRVYTPMVEFETRNGEKITFTASIGSTAEPRVGRKVKVSYFADNPQDADIVSLLRSWLLPGFVLFIAAAFIVFSLMFFTAFFGTAT